MAVGSKLESPKTSIWDRLTVASVLGYCLLVASQSVGAVLGELREDFDLSGVVAALHGSTFGVGLLIAGVFGVALVDRIGRRTTLLAAATGMVSGIMLFCSGGSWPVTLTGTAISGLGGALLVMVMPGLISDHHGENRTVAFTAVNGVPLLCGLAFSLVLGAAIQANWSWRTAYAILTLIVAVSLAAVAWPVVVPNVERSASFRLSIFRDRKVLVPWLFIVNAILTEFTVGIWAATYLKEVGGASGGVATALAGVFAIMMFSARHLIAGTMRVLGPATIRVSFIMIGVGALVMCFGPGLTGRVIGLIIAGFAGGPLYPLTVDRLYRQAGESYDSVALGAVCSLASGVAVVVGPIALGILADAVGLRWAMLFVPVLAAIGAVTQWHAPSTTEG